MDQQFYKDRLCMNERERASNNDGGVVDFEAVPGDPNQLRTHRARASMKVRKIIKVQNVSFNVVSSHSISASVITSFARTILEC